MTFKWDSELLEASTLKSPKETGWSQIRIWSLMAAYFFYLDCLFDKDLDLPNEKTNFLKVKIKDCPLSSFKLYNEKGPVSSLNKNEIFALKTLSKNKDLIIQKSDQGNSIVLINKSDYLDKMYNILSDSKKNVKPSVVDD